MWSAFVVVVAALAADPSPGIPGFDARLEQIVFDGASSGEGIGAVAGKRGEFVREAGAVVVKALSPWGETSLLYDMPFADGLVRARFRVGENLDHALVFRALLQSSSAPSSSAVLGGPRGAGATADGDKIGTDSEIDGAYGITMEKGIVRLVRWEHRIPRSLGSEQKLEPPPKPGDVVEVVVTAGGPWLQASVFSGATMARMAHLAAVDRGFDVGNVGWRVGRWDRGSSLLFLSVGNTRPPPALPTRIDLSWDGDAAGAGVDRVLSINESDVVRLPLDLQKKITAREGGLALIATDPTGVERVRRLGIGLVAHKTQIPWRHIDPILRARLGKPPTKTSAGFRVDESYKDETMVSELLAAYAERFPKITRLVEIGRSGEGRRIMALVISKGAANDDDAVNRRPSFLLDGAHHGGELLSPEFVLDAVQQLTERYGKDKELTRFVDGAAIWCVPIVNVDGNHRYVWETRDYDRKNARDIDANGRMDGWDGVDLYRNYDVGWGGLGEVGSRSWPFHYRYRGPNAGSEPEIQAMMAMAKRERFVASIDYHTNATKILVPYTDPSMENPDVNEAWLIAEEIAATLPIQVNKKMYEVARNLYPVDGTAQDYFRAAFGTVALLVEGPQNNPMPYDKTRTANVVPGRGIWQGLLRRVVDGPSIRGYVVDAGGNPVEANVTVLEQAPKRGEQWTARPRDGFFQRLVPIPGRYTLIVKSPGNKDIIRGVDVGAGPVRVDIVIR
ncbi:MAG: M14 family zinc carboxypeptidase [Deltaproteobacteria bacterium]|nr:M14 family zinc carboxypeptidase [Deltaproteobacteria bacterium]